MIRSIRKNLKQFAAIIALMVVAILVGGYIMKQQRLRFPWEASPITMYVELETAQAVTPGQGQNVQVAGVKIGLVGAVKLEEGRARVRLDIDKKYKGLVRENARAYLRPRTPLKDMYVQIAPGTKEARPVKGGWTIPVANTEVDVQFEHFLETLDERTREYVTLLVDGTGRGLDGQAEKLTEVFERFAPTVRDLRAVNMAVGQERRALRRVVSSLADLNTELAKRPEDLTRLVDASAETFEALSSESDRIQESLRELPPTLRQASETLNDVRPLARELGPATRALTPALDSLRRANASLREFAPDVEPVVRRELRPFARTARPLVRELRPAARDLSRTIPELTRSGRVANRFFNMLASNPNGAEGPEVTNREEGFLFWIGWLFHQTVYLQNITDANGPMRPIFLTGTCSSLTTLVTDNPLMEFGLNLSPLLATVCNNPNTTSVNLQELLNQIPAPIRDLLPLPRDADGTTSTTTTRNGG